MLAYYRRHGRFDLPWRRITDPYRIAVSELMLQQTQVPRVIEKYKTFLKRFPTVRSLARASLAEVLAAWSGLGYNRRAKFLHEMACAVVRDHGGRFPRNVDALERLPGIGHYTARAIAAFAYNQPVVLVETNVRTVFIYHFFPRSNNISDAALLPYIEAALDRRDPRRWYSALMDYGTHLKATGITTHRSSAHYKKQSAFKGSARELRGAIIRALTRVPATVAELAAVSGRERADVEAVAGALCKEGLIAKRERKYALLS